MYGLVVICGLATILAIFGSLSAIKNKNLLGIVFGLGTVGVIGWFTIMTIIHNGYPVAA